MEVEGFYNYDYCSNTANDCQTHLRWEPDKIDGSETTSNRVKNNAMNTLQKLCNNEIFSGLEDHAPEDDDPPRKKLCVLDDMVKVLVDCGANINMQDYSGRTPLMVAMEQKNTIAARTLLALNANPNISDNREITPLQYALHSIDKCFIKIFINAGLGNGMLLNAILEGGTKYLQILKNCGLDVSTKLSGNMTAAHIAASQGDSATLEWLLNTVGSELVRAKANLSETPLHMAAESGHIDCVRILLRYDAQPNQRDKRGWTPLRWAVIEGHDKVADVIRQAGGKM